jgi:hypothetical protein
MKQPSNIKNTNSAFRSIRDQLLALPPDTRKIVSGELLAFLLHESKAGKKAGSKRPQDQPAGITDEQLRQIRSLGDEIRDLHNLMGDDLYFFM